ncbi:n-carbamoyl-d-amino acid hydrolase [Ophiostoma piceae UAMH 11346]|uniref:N-carbamoyl-d-amino acid hydrolase n=1 Tax=Ophiostoma piceae (strain UAMH 11346) TaxID=1262450 RepID=S3CFW6_OPHP1|nr:n-carbamoyl-d-amino acid hydrolase [Ophiostoma piceae UAMH 11346]
MARSIVVAAAQLGPILSVPNPGGPEPRKAALDRMIALLEDAASKGAQLVVFPELALTTFFPRGMLTDPAEIAAVFEPEDDSTPLAASKILESPNIKPLFQKAAALGVDISIGYAERYTSTAASKTVDYNTAIYYKAASNSVIAKYRKVHLPGRTFLLPDPKASQQLEKYYFTPGDLGFQAFRVPGLVDAVKAEDKEAAPDTKTDGKGDPIMGMMICNDRRWPEAWRAYGLQGVELVLCGYNTSDYKPQDEGTFEEQSAMALLHHHISCQGGSYTNACFSVNVAKAGTEAEGPGGGLIGGSVIYDPYGRKVIESKTLEDELLVATLDLDMCRKQKDTIFNFAQHRRVEHYPRLVEQVGVVEPALLSKE